MRIRIVCKAPSVHCGRCQVPASGADTRVFAVAEDGTESELEGVTAVMWQVNSPSDVATARLVFAGVDVDVEAVVEPAKESP